METYLLISGIQHFVFCPRQWALIHIEQQWNDNYFTSDGEVMHERVHDDNSSFKRGELLQVNSLHVKNDVLKIEGVCDAVEFRSCDNGVELYGRHGHWSILPIEYKRGKTKANDSDILQVVAQAICLEEMFCCTIEKCAIYYGKTHSRDYITITDSLRNRLASIIFDMHKYYNQHYTPKGVKTEKCNSCSLCDFCVPDLFSLKKNVNEYIKEHIKE
mgnify:CR=1 FL=1